MTDLKKKELAKNSLSLVSSVYQADQCPNRKRNVICFLLLEEERDYNFVPLYPIRKRTAILRLAESRRHGIEWLLPSHAPTNYLTPKWISNSPRRVTQRVTTGIVRIDHVPHGIFISRCSPMLPRTSMILDLFLFRDPHGRRYLAGVALLKTCYPKAPPFSSS